MLLNGASSAGSVLPSWQGRLDWVALRQVHERGGELEYEPPYCCSKRSRRGRCTEPRLACEVYLDWCSGAVHLLFCFPLLANA
jgi:hypothetical protein